MKEGVRDNSLAPSFIFEEENLPVCFSLQNAMKQQTIDISDRNRYDRHKVRSVIREKIRNAVNKVSTKQANIYII
ncbi:MAG: hypothetical protein WCW53_08020 [Syntrophales bacterium]